MHQFTHGDDAGLCGSALPRRAATVLPVLSDSPPYLQNAHGSRYSEVLHSFFILGCRLVTQDSSNEITAVCFRLCGTVEMGSELSWDVLT